MSSRPNLRGWGESNRVGRAVVVGAVVVVAVEAVVVVAEVVAVVVGDVGGCLEECRWS